MSQANSKASAPKPIGKTDKVIGLLKRNGGATLADIVAATSWQPHTARAVLTGLRKKGHSITREKVDGISHYRIDTDPAA